MAHTHIGSPHSTSRTTPASSVAIAKPGSSTRRHSLSPSGRQGASWLRARNSDTRWPAGASRAAPARQETVTQARGDLHLHRRPLPATRLQSASAMTPACTLPAHPANSPSQVRLAASIWQNGLSGLGWEFAARHPSVRAYSNVADAALCGKTHAVVTDPVIVVIRLVIVAAAR